MVRREPVPALPKSSGASGSSRQPLPTPLMIHSPPVFSIRAPIAFIASPVRITSSPSSRPVMRVSPEARPPNMKERCEIDLSPGTRATPFNAGERRATAGRGCALCVIMVPRAGVPAALQADFRRSPIMASGDGHPLRSRGKAPFRPDNTSHSSGRRTGASFRFDRALDLWLWGPPKLRTRIGSGEIRTWH